MKAQMRSLPVSRVLAGLAVFGSAQMQCKADDLPGVKEQAEVDSANAVLDRVYRDLMSKAEPEEKTSLQEAERAWIKWRDAEAVLSRVTAAPSEAVAFASTTPWLS